MIHISSEALIWIGAILFLVIITSFLLVRKFSNRPTLVSEQMIGAFKDMGSVKTMLEAIENAQRELSQNLQRTQTALEGFKAEYEARKQFDEANRVSLKRLEEIIAGTKTKGMAGENILREILGIFPPEMVVTQFKVKGKEVEFGLVLPNKKIVPIDSKWTSSDLLENLSREKDELERTRIKQKIENEVGRRVTEVAQYIDADITVPWAIAAIPDAAFSICKTTHLSAYKKGIILIPYQLTLPYLLTLFNLHLQYATSIDIENLHHYLVSVKRALSNMDDILENRIQKASVMIDNAARDYRHLISLIKDSLTNIESSEGVKT